MKQKLELFFKKEKNQEKKENLFLREFKNRKN
jgi:hypothetical protein